jgi:DNA repair protein RadC
MKQNNIAEVQITYSSKIKSADRIKIISSSEAAKAFRTFWPSFEHVEFAYLLLLNRQNQIIGQHFLAKGGISGTVVDVRMIFQVALKANATSIMMAHNHPSGNLQVSEADRKITRQIKDAGALLDIPILDHIILTEEGYLSFADEGYL